VAIFLIGIGQGPSQPIRRTRFAGRPPMKRSVGGVDASSRRRLERLGQGGDELAPSIVGLAGASWKAGFAQRARGLAKGFLVSNKLEAGLAPIPGFSSIE